jgi:hypothetical protein
MWPEADALVPRYLPHDSDTEPSFLRHLAQRGLFRWLARLYETAGQFP